MLTPTGAQLLRDVRDHIVAHPETFDWAEWRGTRCCIAGHLMRMSKRTRMNGEGFSEYASDLLGLSRTDTHELFYGYATSPVGGMAVRYDIPHAVQCINDFLWRYGYPANPVADPAGLALPQAVEK